MAIEAVAAAATAAGIEAAKNAAIEAARQVAEKVVSNTLENARATQATPHQDTVAQIQQMENQRINEYGGKENSEKAALKQKEVEAIEMLKDKIEGQQENHQTTYDGGSYGDLAKNRVEGTEKHHMPPASINGLERNDGPAIRMDIADHRQTASHGTSNEAREYRAQQEQRIKEGNFEEAMKVDITDVKEKFGAKYDDAITQAKEYYARIHDEGKC